MLFPPQYCRFILMLYSNSYAKSRDDWMNMTLCNPVDCSPPSGVGCHAVLQGIFPTQGSYPGLLHCRWILYCLSQQGSIDLTDSNQCAHTEQPGANKAYVKAVKNKRRRVKFAFREK